MSTVPDTYYDLEKVKNLLGETGDTNNTKITLYGNFADNEINIALQNLEDNIPLLKDDIPTILREIANALAVAFFYKYESGSEDLLPAAQTALATYIDTHYSRPDFKTAGNTC